MIDAKLDLRAAKRARSILPLPHGVEFFDRQSIDALELALAPCLLVDACQNVGPVLGIGGPAMAFARVDLVLVAVVAGTIAGEQVFPIVGIFGVALLAPCQQLGVGHGCGPAMWPSARDGGGASAQAMRRHSAK
jgi:hypothetical protein